MNFVLIMSDSMDGRVMSCAGDGVAHTPNLQKLADRGTMLLNTYTNSPQCCPARASLWSGQYTHKIEGWNNYKGLEIGAPTFQTEMQKSDYQFKVLGKSDYLSGSHTIAARVPAWISAASVMIPENSRPDGRITGTDVRVHSNDWTTVDKAVQWLQDEGKNSEKPFFLYVGVNNPHPAFRTSEFWMNKIDQSKISIPPYEENLHPVMKYMSVTKGTYDYFSPEEIRKIRSVYYAMVAETDSMVGKLMGAVNDMGLSDNTIFIYTSDHGEMDMAHRQQLKNCFYEGSARIPFIIVGPGIKKGYVVNDFVSLIDLFPTLMDFADMSHPLYLQGNSLIPLLQGKMDKERPDYVFSEYHSNMMNTSGFMIRKGPWKYIAYYKYPPQLFNLDEDPEELNDLSVKLPAKTKEMDDLLKKMVDVNQVGAKVEAYNRDSFRQWRKGLNTADYQKTMNSIFENHWDKNAEDQLEQWLDNP
jgi:arylsulfatase K